MGSSDSKCAALLEQMGWDQPPLAEEFRNPSLVSYLQNQKLEVVLPKHAPQADLSIGDKKPSLFPRPNFCWEAYKMHVALIGPSTSCKEQLLTLLSQLVPVFPGTPSTLAPGKEAKPYYFFDADLHTMILWQLPEMDWNEADPDTYIRGLGLLYMDCIFVLFSEKYLLSDVYCKLVVNLAVHGVPFFIICTDSRENTDPAELEKLKHYFQRKDILGIKMLNPNNPIEMLHELITEFFQEVSRNRSEINKNVVENIGDPILGQPARLKGLLSKADLNERCGVCVGFHKETSRYHVRLITNGVESDVAVKKENLTILNPRLLHAMVQIKDLRSKPELNGRYGFTDAYLRDSNRYRVLLPGPPGRGQAVALKALNIERVEETHGYPVAAPSAPEPPKRSTNVNLKPTHGPFVAESKGGTTWKVIGGHSKGGIIVRKGYEVTSEAETERLSTDSLIEEITKQEGRLHYRLLYGTGPQKGWVSLATKGGDLLRPYDGVVSGSRVAKAPWRAFHPPAQETSPVPAHATSTSVSSARTEPDKGLPHDDDDLASFLPKINISSVSTATPSSPSEADGRPIDLMSRIKMAEAGASHDSLSHAPEQCEKLSKKDFIAMETWVVVGDPEAEDLVDHLMDNGKTVYYVCSEGGYASCLQDLAKDENVNKIQVLAFVDKSANPLESVNSAPHLKFQGVLLHPDTESFPEAQEALEALGFAVFGVDILEEIGTDS